MSDIVNFSIELRARCSKLIEDLQSRYHLVITIHDDLGILRLPDGNSLIDRPFHHMHPYCLLERDQHAEYDRQCVDYCSRQVSKRCRVNQQPYLSSCWKGMREIIVPIWRNGTHHITLYAAGFRGEKPNLSSDHSFSQEVQEAYLQLGEPDELKINEMTRVLQTVGLGLLQEIDNARQMIHNDNARKQQIKQFIYNYAHQECTLKDLAAYMFLSPSRCSKVVRDLFKTPFQELVINERLERSKHLLLNSRLKQEAIATQCGFNNHFYFGRLFKKYIGISPGKFRKQAKNQLTQKS